MAYGQGAGKQLFWRARNNSQAGSQIVVNYFTQFPLFTSKYLDFVGSLGPNGHRSQGPGYRTVALVT